MLDRSVTKIGAMAAMVGAVLALGFNALHPRTSNSDEIQTELELIQDNGIWLFDHYMIAWSIGIIFFGLIVIARSFDTEPARSWGRVALPFIIGGTALIFAAVAIDGMGMEQISETWAESSDKAATLAIADVVANVGGAIFVAAIGALFGLMPIILAMAFISSADYPSWLGGLGIAGGLLGLLTSTIMFFGGITDATLNVMFPITAVMLTVLVFIAGLLLWRKVTAPVAAAAARAEVA